MKNIKKSVHFVDNYLLQPTNPISVNLIGTGGTGSQMLSALARINYALRKLGHTGLQVRAFDDDRVSEANLGRQLFAEAELGLYKSTALINRLNRFYGTNWKSEQTKYDHALLGKQQAAANITISCVDTVQARFEIANIVRSAVNENSRDKPIYWMDFGNGFNTGQVILSTVLPIRQPASKKFNTVAILPQITEEFKDLLMQQKENNEPSCSIAESLDKQDLFVNSALAGRGASLLWQLFRKGMTFNRGFFINLEENTIPLKVA